MAEESRTKVIVVDFGYPVMLFGLLTPKDWSYLAFQSYNYECARGRLFQKRILCTKVAIYMYVLFAQDIIASIRHDIAEILLKLALNTNQSI
jgi:hypothetical protein